LNEPLTNAVFLLLLAELELGCCDIVITGFHFVMLAHFAFRLILH